MMLRRVSGFLILGTVLCSTTWAHPGHDAIPTNGLISGLLHPLMGLDHLLVAVAVGLLAARGFGPKIGLTPGVFLSGMMLGMGTGRSFPTWPVLEFGIAATLILSGGLLFNRLAKSLAIALPILVACGFYHGFVHAVEMPVTHSSWVYLTGLLIGTGTMHAFGIAAGRLALRGPQGRDCLRWAGAAIAGVGIAMMAIH